MAAKLSYVLLYRGAGRIYALDLGSAHRNPNGERVGETHKHRWTAEFRDKQAYVPKDITATWDRPPGGLATVLRRGEDRPPRHAGRTICSTTSAAMNPDDLCESLRDRLPTLFECTSAPHGSVRVRTPFMYPDGDIVDVFVEQRGGGVRRHRLRRVVGLAPDAISPGSVDGESASTGRGCVSHRWRRTGPRATDAPVRERLGTERRHPSSRAGRGPRLRHLVHDTQPGGWRSVADEVEAWLRERKFDSKRNARRDGRSGRKWMVDYEVVAKTQTSHVFLLTTGSQAWARRLSERAVAACTDLSHLTFGKPDASFVSLFDDTVNVWRDEDFALVEPFSRIAVWSQSEEFEHVLTTASPPPAMSLTSH